MTPERVEEIVNQAVREMMENPSCTPEIIAMVIAHLRATLAPLVKVETERGT